MYIFYFKIHGAISPNIKNFNCGDPVLKDCNTCSDPALEDCNICNKNAKIIFESIFKNFPVISIDDIKKIYENNYLDKLIKVFDEQFLDTQFDLFFFLSIKNILYKDSAINPKFLNMIRFRHSKDAIEDHFLTDYFKQRPANIKSIWKYRSLIYIEENLKKEICIICFFKKFLKNKDFNIIGSSEFSIIYLLEKLNMDDNIQLSTTMNLTNINKMLLENFMNLYYTESQKQELNAKILNSLNQEEQKNYINLNNILKSHQFIQIANFDKINRNISCFFLEKDIQQINDNIQIACTNNQFIKYVNKTNSENEKFDKFLEQNTNIIQKIYQEQLKKINTTSKILKGYIAIQICNLAWQKTYLPEETQEQNQSMFQNIKVLFKIYKEQHKYKLLFVICGCISAVFIASRQ